VAIAPMLTYIKDTPKSLDGKENKKKVEIK
jgi:hypothetical protein